MRVIGIDTASGTASVALVENGSLLSERTDSHYESTGNGNSRSGKSKHAATLLPLMELLLESTGVSFQDISGFALSIGPGSFTGLRIGLSTVKGLAYGGRIPVVGVSTLLAHAARVTDHHGLICALLDARRNEVYAAVFRKTGNVVERVTEDAVTSAANVVEIIRSLQKDTPCLFVGDGALIYKPLLLDLPGTRLLETTNYPTVAGAVARLAEDRFRSNEVDDLGTLMPVYVSPSQAAFKSQSSL
jgi:tRNA threonylcarbamoyladenosine biosynthesis protein TsaB